MRPTSPTAACLILLGLSSVAAADSAVEPEARKTLDAVAEAYRALPAYSDQGAFTVRVTQGEDRQEVVQPWRVAFVRPDKIALDAGAARLIGDGKLLASVIVATRSYSIDPAPETIRPDTIGEGPVGALLLGGPWAVPASFLLNLTFGPDPVEALLAGGGGLRSLADAEHEGKPVAVLVVEPSVGPSYRLLIDRESKLLRAIESIPSDAKEGEKTAEVSIDWTSGPIATTPPDPMIFDTSAPAGYAEVVALADAKPDRPDEPEHPLVGKPAPQFSLDVLDDDNKTRRVTSDDLRGKVVVLDFWATWCGPCLRELPEIDRYISGLENQDKPVIVVAVSQDEEPKDSSVRSLVESTLKEQKLILHRPPVGLVALDPESAMGKAFKVEALPTLFLIDQEGKVRSAHIGYSDDIRQTLTREVEALLAGKDPASKQSDGEKPAAAAAEKP